jgi:RNA polymerase sigma factor (sigma-70 family)
MDSGEAAPAGQGAAIDQEMLVREIGTLRTYLLCVAGNFPGASSSPSQGTSDLVDSVLVEVLEGIREGREHLEFQSSAGLRAWLAQRLRWAHWDRVRRHERYREMLANLPPRPVPQTPSSEVRAAEQARLLAEARAKLAPGDRELIAWRHDEGLTFHEIGRRRGCSISYARRAYLQAMRNFRSSLRSLD